MFIKNKHLPKFFSRFYLFPILIANNTDSLEEIFGTPAITGILNPNDAPSALGGAAAFLIKFFIVIASFAALIYLLWGAFDYINSQGDKEKLSQARQKIIHAIIGLILIFVILVVFGYIAGDMLGIIQRTPEGWKLKLPRIGE